MVLSRDSMIWLAGMIGAVVTAIAVNVDQFDWFSDTAKHWISLAAVVVAAVSGKMATSPLPSEQAAAVADAKAKVVDAKRELVQVEKAKEPKARVRRTKHAAESGT